jgi:predicted phosphate transport protein (TIGR00153 family)
MKLAKIFSFFLPKERKFFPLFIEIANNLVEVSNLLVILMKETDISVRNELILQIRKKERIGDGLTGSLKAELNDTFITPLDREDIHDLITNLDDVVDSIYAASKRILYYKPSCFPEEFHRIAEIISDATLEIQLVFQNVKKAADFAKHKLSCERIREMESIVDEIYQSYLANLFEHPTDVVDLIKKRDILTTLEKTIDKCNDVSNIFSTLIIKMS